MFQSVNHLGRLDRFRIGQSSLMIIRGLIVSNERGRNKSFFFRFLSSSSSSSSSVRSENVSLARGDSILKEE